MIYQESLGIDIRENSLVIACLRGGQTRVRMKAGSFYSLDADLTIREKLNAVKGLISDFKAENRIGDTSIYLGLPRDMTLAKEVELPMAVRENLGEALRYEIEKHFPLSSEHVHFDYQIVGENRSKKRLKVLIVVVKKSELNAFLDFCKDLPGGVSGIEGVSTAIANSHAYAANGKRPKRKTKDPSGESADDPTDYRADALRTDEALAERIGVPSLDFVVAFGLGLKGLRPTPLHINLLPTAQRRKKGRIGFYIMTGLWLIVILAALVWGGSFMIRHRMAVQSMNEELKQLTSEVKQVEDIQARLEKKKARLAEIYSLGDGNPPILEIIRELTQVIPETAWVQEFRLSESGIQVNGFAESASELIGVLESSPLFKDVVFQSAIVKGRDGKERFSIGLKTEGELSVQDENRNG